MLWTHPAILAGVGTLAGAAAVVGRNAVRGQRRRRERRARESWQTVGRSRGLEMSASAPTVDVMESASRYQGQRSEVRLGSVLLCSDRDGRFWMGRRKVAGVEHHVLGFEVRGDLGVKGLHIEPVERGERSRSWLPWKRGKLEGKSRLRLRLTWESEAEAFVDPTIRHSVDRWLTKLVPSLQDRRRPAMGLEVHRTKGWVHSIRPLVGKEYETFLLAALEIRREVQDEVRRRPATVLAETANESPSEARRRRDAKQDTRPLFPVGRAEGAEDDPTGRTIRLSAEDLLREPLETRNSRPIRRPKAKIFEIPEPEEEVVLIKAQ